MLKAFTLIALLAALASCGPAPTPGEEATPVTDSVHAIEADAEEPSALQSALPDVDARDNATVRPSPPANPDATMLMPTGSGPPPAPALEIYTGRRLMEELIIQKGTIVRADLTSVVTETVLGTDGVYYSGADNRYLAVIKFNLSVTEYLLGLGPANVVAVWVNGLTYDDESTANQELALLAANRDDQWDDREAIIFLYHGAQGFGTILDAQLREPDHFFLATGGDWDDNYSLHSANYLQWLPEYYFHLGGELTAYHTALDADHLTGEGLTYLRDIRRLIAKVNGELAANGGTDAQRKCVLRKYEHMRELDNWPQDRMHYTKWEVAPGVTSGQPSGAVVIRRTMHTFLPITDPLSEYDIRATSTDGLALFAHEANHGDPEDITGDGKDDWVPVHRRITTSRPLPAGDYSVTITEKRPQFALCGYEFSSEWTVSVPSPEERGSVHEFFFDPVTDGNTVAASASVGVLKPRDFTNNNGSAASIVRLEWALPTVTLTAWPISALADLALDIIELDGSVSLTLDYTDATVDAARSTLAWSVDYQPWDAGDTLMVRVRKQ